MGIDFSGELNASQLEAATALDGPYLVIAGAGSGKTRTLIYRVGALIEAGVPPGSILLLTFTRKAAEQMITRAADITPASRDIIGGTFHSFCCWILRRYSGKLGIRADFTILDAADSAALMSFIRTSSGMSRDDPHFPKTKVILDVLSKVINRDEVTADVLVREYPQYAGYEPGMRSLIEQYRRYKLDNNLMDYDDLLIWAEKLLAEGDAVRQTMRKRFTHIMVDEYQDTNPIQARIAGHLAGINGNIMVVGDDCQSIYGFRGADWRNIMEFPKANDRSRIIKLERNYRSTQPILDLSNRLIDAMEEKFEKKLYTEEKGGEKPMLFEFDDAFAEASHVADSISRMIADGRAPEDIAVLYRTNWASNHLEQALNERGMKYVKYGGVKFLEKAHIKDVIAHLSAARNIRDGWSWTRALRVLPGIGPAKAGAIIADIRKSGLSGMLASTRGKSDSHLMQLREIMEKVRDSEHDAADALKLVFAHYGPYMETAYPEDFVDRSMDLETLSEMGAGKEVGEFLDSLSLDPPNREGDDGAGSIVLSTIHQAKGLEWDAVFIIHLNDGQLPHSRSMEDPQDMAEELRLFYVAATRAKSRLTLTRPNARFIPARGQAIELAPSRFLDHISDLIDGTEEPKKPADIDAASMFIPANRL